MANYLAAFNLKGKLGLKEKLVLSQGLSTWESLSTREKQALALLAEGLEYSEIASRMHISVNGVRAHIKNIYKIIFLNSKEKAVLSRQ